MKKWAIVVGVLCLALPACGSDDDGGGSGGSGGSAAGGTGGAAGSSTGGAAGSSTGGAAGSSTGGAAGSGTGGAAGSSTGGAGGATACNNLVNDGADIAETSESGTPPTMTGGTITDGTWVLTGRKDWQGSCGCTSRQKLVISGSGTMVQLVNRTDSDPDQRLSATVVAVGNELNVAATCPASLTLKQKYTATATELQIFDEADQSLNIFTKK